MEFFLFFFLLLCCCFFCCCCDEFERGWCEGRFDMSGLGAFKRLNSAQLTDHHGWMDGIVAATPYLFFSLSPLLFLPPPLPFTDLTFSHYPSPPCNPINLFIHCLYFAVSVSPLGPLFSPSPSPPLSPTLAFFSIPTLGVVVVCNWFGFCYSKIGGVGLCNIDRTSFMPPYPLLGESVFRDLSVVEIARCV